MDIHVTARIWKQSNWPGKIVSWCFHSQHVKRLNTIFDLARAKLVSSLVGRSFVKAATMETAVNGFRKTGLWPPNRHVFDEEFRE